MPEFYEVLPTQAVNQASYTSESLNNSVTYEENGSPKITNLFLISSGENLEFIHKYSLRAFWLGFIKSIKQLFGIRDETFNIEQNLARACQFVAVAAKADAKFFGAAEAPRARQKIRSLGKFLLELKKHVETKREARQISIDRLRAITIPTKCLEKVEKVAKSYHFDTLAQFQETSKKLLQEAFGNRITDEELQEAISCLSRQSSTNCVFEGLEKAIERKQQNKPAKEKDLDALRLLLMKSLACLQGASGRTILSLLSKIEPALPTLEPDYMALEKFAKVMGDAFMKDSGLEGDWSSRPYADMMLDFLRVKNLQTPGAKALKEILESHIDLRDPSLRNEPIGPRLKANLDARGRCLLYGGWQKHAIVFEAVKQPNGLYTFRVYNEGAGINQHSHLDTKYKAKFQGFLGINDIPERLLFQETFLHSLQGMTQMPDEGLMNITPETFLINHLLPMLGAADETTLEGKKRFLSPQRSGSCTYRSLLAFIANFMTEEEYRQFNFQFKMHVVTDYLPRLKARGDLAIISEEGYNDARREYNLLLRAIEKFANSVKKAYNVLPEKEVINAEKASLQYKTYLANFERQILAFEKSIWSEQPQGPLSAQDERLYLPQSQRFEDVLASGYVDNYPFGAPQRDLLQMIHAMPQDLRTLEECQRLLVSMKNDHTLSTEEFFFIAESLFRKLGSIHAFDSFRFSHSQDALKQLHEIALAAAEAITSSDMKARCELRGIYFFACYGIEQAMKQLPKNERIIESDFTAIICKNDAYRELRTSDPFWASVFQDIRRLVSRRDERHALFRDMTLKRDWDYEAVVELDPLLVNSVLAWWTSDANSALRLEVDQSVRADREEQKREIERRIAAEQAAIVGYRQELEAIINNPPMRSDQNDYDQWQRKVGRLKSSIERSNAIIAHTPTDVENDAKYWPKGFETPAHLGGMSDQQKVSFFFARKSDFFVRQLHGRDILTPEFRRFSYMAILARNIFTKRDKPYDIIENIVQSYYWNSEKRHIRPLCNFSYDEKPAPLENDVYFPHIRGMNEATLYKAVFEERTLEPMVPRSFATFEKNRMYQTLDSDDAKELYCLRATRDVQLEAACSYFHENLEKLEQHDWFSIFHSFIFEEDLLLAELQHSKNRVRFLERAKFFFASSIKNALLLNDFSLTANLLWMASDIQRFAAFTAAGRPVEAVVDSSILYELVDKVAEQQFAEHWPVVFEAIIAASCDVLSRKPQTPEEKKRFGIALFAHLIYAENPAPQSKRSQLRLEAARKAQMLIKERLSEQDGLTAFEIEALCKETLVPLVGKLFPSMRNTNFTARTPRELKGSDGSKIALVHGLIIPQDPSHTRVYANYPSEYVLDDLRKVSLYGIDADLSHLRAHKQAGITYVYDPVLKLEIALSRRFQYFGDLRIDIRRLDGAWMHYIDPEVRNYCNNFELKHKYHHVMEGGRLTLLDKSTLDPVYQTEGSRLRRLEDNLLVAQSPQNLSFASFEAASCTTYLANDTGEVQRILFSRLNLSLEKQDLRLVVSEQKEWHVASEQFVPHFGQGSGFLVLENALGQKKVLLPVWKPVHTQEEKKSLAFAYSYDFEEEKKRQGHFVEYDLSGTKMLPRCLEGRFYLAKVYLEKGRIEEAERLLFSHAGECSSRKLSSEERAILEEILKKPYSKDAGSQIVRNRLRALYLLEKNAEQFPEVRKNEKPQDTKDAELQEHISLAFQYLNRIGHTQCLEAQQEKYILERLQLKLSTVENGRNYKNAQEQIQHHQMKPLALQAKERLEIRLKELAGTLPEKKTIRSRLQSEALPFANIPVTFAYFSGSSYEPTDSDKLRYKLARENNSFPFDPLQMSSQELETYYKLIEDEVNSTYFFSTANKNGLHSTLYYLAFFSQDPTVRNQAWYFLTRLFEKELFLHSFMRFIWPNVPAHEFRTYKGWNPQEVPKAVTEVHLGLFSLDFVKGSIDASSFLQTLAASYFTKIPSPPKAYDANAVFSASCPQAKDATIKKKFEKMANDIAFALNLPPEDTYIKTQELDGLGRQIQDRLDREQECLQKQEEVIVQSVHLALTADRRASLAFLSKKRRLPSIQELSFYAAKQDPKSCIKKHFPELSSDACEKLMSAVKQYLIQKRFCQQLAVSLQTLREVAVHAENDRSALRSLENMLGKILQASPGYEVDDPLANLFLALETSLQLTLRQDQVDNIRLYIKSIKEGKPISLQMIMGAGKTHVLQPLLACLLADGDALSTVTVHEALFEPVREGLASTLGSAFDVQVFSLPFERELSTNNGYLQSLHDKLLEIHERRGVLLITPRQRHSIIASFYEAYYDLVQESNDKTEARVELMTKICRILQFQEVNQIDEIDYIMDSKVTFKYPIGMKEAVEAQKASLVSELVLELSTDEEIASAVSLDFAHNMRERLGKMGPKVANSFTTDLYDAIIAGKLRRKAVELLVKRSKTFERLLAQGADPEGYISHFLTQTTPYDDKIQNLCLPKEEQILIRLLPKDHDALKAIIQDQAKPALERLLAEKQLYRLQMHLWLLKEIPDSEERDLLGVLAHAISNILPHSLAKVCGANYGIDLLNNKFVARPYEAAGSPKPTQYSDPYEQVIYSTQMALYYGVPREAALKILTNLQREAKLEMNRNSCTLQETESYQLYSQIMQESVDAFFFLQQPAQEPLVDTFQRKLSCDTKWIMFFLKGHVYTQISRYKESVSSTPQTLVGFSKIAGGYTGTPHEEILPRNMTQVLEKGTDGKTIIAVESKNPSVVPLSEKGQKKLPDLVIERFLLDKSRFVFTDAGGWLKEENIEQYAERLLLACEKSGVRSDIKGIIYHNAKGEIMSLERDSANNQRSLPISKSRFNSQQGKQLTIIQQKYKAGTNILQKGTAKCFISVCKGMTMRDALQSEGRMRRIWFDQEVEFGIDDEVKSDLTTAIIDGLLKRLEFRALLTNDASFDPALVDTLNLEPDIAQSLKAAFSEILNNRELVAEYRKGNVMPKKFCFEFIKHFTNSFVVDSKSLERYFAANQAEAEKERNWLAGRQRMREAIEKPIRMAMLDLHIPQVERKELFMHIQQLMITTEEDSPFDKLSQGSKLLDAKAAIDREVDRFFLIWKSLEETKSCLGICSQAIVLPELQEKIHQYAASLYPNQSMEEVLRSCVNEADIPEVVLVTESIQGQELEQEEEQERENEFEREVEIIRQDKLPDEKEYSPLVSYSEDRGYKVAEFFAYSLLPIHNILASGVKLPFSDSLYYSPNLFLDHAQIGSPKGGMYHLPGRFLLAIHTPNAPRRYLLVSHEDAARIKKGLCSYEISPPQSLELFSLDGQLVLSSNPAGSSVAADDFHRKILCFAKVLTVRVNFTKEETERLRSTFGDDRAQAFQLQKLFEKGIQHKPACAKRYFGSHLERMFTALVPQQA